MKRFDLLVKLETVYAAIRKDVNAAYPGAFTSKDMEVLSFRLKTRGLGFVTLDLPLLSKALLRGLESGSLPRVPGFGLASKGQVPAFMQGLWKMVFDFGTGMLLEEADECVVKLLETICNFSKGMKLPAKETIKKECINEYKKIELSIPEPTRFWWDLDYNHPIVWDGSVPHIPSFTDRRFLDESVSRAVHTAHEHSSWRDGQSGGFLDSLQQHCDRFCSRIPEYHPSSEIWWERKQGRRGVKHGPGAVASGSRGIDKYHFQRWSLPLESQFPKEDFLPKWEGPIDSLLPSRLCAVLKDATKVRLIAAEPVENQWCQQLTAGFISREILNRIVDGQINLKKQSLSQEAARKGSIHRKTCTIDLSDASDRLSLLVIERMFRKHPTLLRALRAHRTQYLYIDDTGETLRLCKFATQGTAVTFPVQSVVYWLLARFSCEWVGADTDEVRVFGDDLVVPTEAYHVLVALLSYSGLKVNATKSFYRGFFRESCGGNYFKGVNVTPLRLKNNLNTDDPNCVRAIRDTSDNAFKSGMWHTAEALRGLDAKAKWRPVVKAGSKLEGLGYISFMGTTFRHLKRRWNSDLQDYEYLVKTILQKRGESKDVRDLSRLNRAIYEMPYLSEGYTSDQYELAGHCEVTGWDTFNGVRAA